MDFRREIARDLNNNVIKSGLSSRLWHELVTNGENWRKNSDNSWILRHELTEKSTILEEKCLENSRILKELTENFRTVEKQLENEKFQLVLINVEKKVFADQLYSVRVSWYKYG